MPSLNRLKPSREPLSKGSHISHRPQLSDVPSPNPPLLKSSLKQDEIQIPNLPQQQSVPEYSFVDNKSENPVNITNFSGLVSPEHEAVFQNMTTELLNMYHDDPALFEKSMSLLNDVLNESNAQSHGFDLKSILNSNDQYFDLFTQKLGLAPQELGFGESTNGIPVIAYDDLKSFQQIFLPTLDIMTTQDLETKVAALDVLAESKRIGDISSPHQKMVENISQNLTSDNKDALDLYSGQLSNSVLQSKVDQNRAGKSFRNNIPTPRKRLKVEDIKPLDLALSRIVLHSDTSTQNLEDLKSQLNLIKSGGKVSAQGQAALLKQGFKYDEGKLFALDKSGKAGPALSGIDMGHLTNLTSAMIIPSSERTPAVQSYLTKYQDVIKQTGLVNELSGLVIEQTEALKKVNESISQDTNDLDEVERLLGDVDVLLERFSKDELSSDDLRILSTLGIEVRPGRFVDNKFFFKGRLIKRKDIIGHLEKRRNHISKSLEKNQSTKNELEGKLTNNQTELVTNLVILGQETDKLKDAYNNLSADEKKIFAPLQRILLLKISLVTEAGLSALFQSATTVGNLNEFSGILDNSSDTGHDIPNDRPSPEQSKETHHQTHIHQPKVKDENIDFISSDFDEILAQNQAQKSVEQKIEAQFMDTLQNQNHHSKAKQQEAQEEERFALDKEQQVQLLNQLKNLK